MLRHPTWKWVGRLWLLSVAALWLACGVDGDRAMMGCPPDEVCDPTTPEGLNFGGQSPSDGLSNTLPTAAGGTQSFWIRGAGTSETIPDAFEAVSSNESVLVVDGVSSARVDVRGVAPGMAQLRIVNEMDELFDRTTLTVSALARIELRSVGNWYSSGLLRSDEPPPDWAFLRGGRARVVAALYSSGDDRLVDGSLAFTEREGLTPDAWDAAVMDLPESGETLELAIVAGGVERVASAPLVGEVESLARQGEPMDLLRTPTVRVGDTDQHCFTPMNAGRVVAGVRFELEVEGPILAEVNEDPATDSLDYGCVRVTGESTGDATLTIRAAGLEKIQPFRVVD